MTKNEEYEFLTIPSFSGMSLSAWASLSYLTDCECSGKYQFHDAINPLKSRLLVDSPNA